MLHFLTTDIELVGVVTWAGLFVTIAGFWIAISQVRKVKTASEAANDAVSRLGRIVRSQELGSKISSAHQHLTAAQAMIKQNNSEAACAHLSVSWAALVSAREFSDDFADREQIGEFVVSARRLLDEMAAPGITTPTAKTLNQRHSRISKTLDGVGTMSARLNALLSGIGISQ